MAGRCVGEISVQLVTRCTVLSSSAGSNVTLLANNILHAVRNLCCLNVPVHALQSTVSYFHQTLSTV
jgi:hypothetical protein